MIIKYSQFLNEQYQTTQEREERLKATLQSWIENENLDLKCKIQKVKGLLDSESKAVVITGKLGKMHILPMTFQNCVFIYDNKGNVKQSWPDRSIDGIKFLAQDLLDCGCEEEENQ